ncbi:ABC transporter permease [Lacrimispora indolis]|uniref:ABC transporter permease n=1 Tax=Lacrimispora indolis TaxID=69825 RepID=UPI00040CCEE8|nr:MULTISPECIES: ABC transporter permease [Lachnospiraceae]MBE7720585.1 ABC transporter permease [Lacrimispora celerecrescens]
MKILQSLFNRNALYEEIGMSDLESTSLYKDAWKRFKKNKFAMVCLVLIILLAVIAVFAPFIAPHDPYEQDVLNKFADISAAHPLGTDNYGRDILSRIIYGTRISLAVGIVAEAIAVTIGVIVGTAAGYYGGKIDTVLSRIIEIFASFPFILFAIAVMFILGQGIMNVFIAIGVIGWTGHARLIRSQVLQLRTKEYAEAARAAGASDFRIMVKHMIPNCLSTIIVITTLDIPSDIMLEATLSFLGLGVAPPTASWGEMISTARTFLRQQPMFSIYPGIAIMITVLAFNTLGDALRDALDPKLKNM